MSTADAQPSLFDLFLSHATADKPWVLLLDEALRLEGLRPFLDVRELEPGANWVLELSGGLLRSRFLVLLLSRASATREWVEQEWTSFVAKHGPRRIVVVMLEAGVELPTILGSVQVIKAHDRDAARVARELARALGRPGELAEGDTRRLTIGQDLVFDLEWVGEQLVINDPAGRRREVPPPWRQDTRFGVASLGFRTLTRQTIHSDAARTELVGHAATLGAALFGLLFDEEGTQALRRADPISQMGPDQGQELGATGSSANPCADAPATAHGFADEPVAPKPPGTQREKPFDRGALRTAMASGRPLITLRSGDDELLALPWELLHHVGRFLVRDGMVDLARSIPGTATVRDPSGPFTLVVNVSAPEGSGLNYEGESYRITRALTERCTLIPTELGTLADLVATVARERPAGIHFSGHGAPGWLVFEDDEGRAAPVPIAELVRELRRQIPDGRLPPFCYLACCHGNDPAASEQGGPESVAARLHREGVDQVVGYHNPIVDELSTRAEEALYAAIAAGHPTRHAVLLAREALARPLGSGTRTGHREPSAAVVADSHPFAWAQLVVYHRGPDVPLSRPAPPGRGPQDDALRRTYLDAGTRRLLASGFIGRRAELHRIRKRIRRGDRVFVFQGLGGLGKTTLALHTLPLLGAKVTTPHAPRQGSDEVPLVLWCQDAEKSTEGTDPIAEALVGQLLEFCRRRFGADWEGVVQQVDRLAGDDAARRFESYLGALLENVPRLVIYLDNMESLLVGPEESRGADDDAAFFAWRSPALAAIWRVLGGFAEYGGKLHVVASCRYRHADFGEATFPVSPLPDDALFRLMGWFPALRRLSVSAREQLIKRLAGHPRAVEFANDLLQDALARWADRHGEWRLPDPPAAADLLREWGQLVEPALPQVQQKLRDDLLFDALWDRVLDDPARRMLYRMTLLRRPWDWEMMNVLGDPKQSPKSAEATADRLRRTSLLEQVDLAVPVRKGELRPVRRYTLHPATAQFIASRHRDNPALRLATHRRVGTYLEALAKSSPEIEMSIEAGHHLFQAGDYDRSNALLGSASDLLQGWGRVREGLRILEPFLAEPVRRAMKPDLVGRLLGTVSLAYTDLGQVEKGVGYYEQALVIFRAIGDRQSEAAILGNLGGAYARLGQVEKAIGYYEQQLAIAREIGDRWNEGAALGSLGIAYADLDQVEKAIDYIEQWLVIAREIGDRRGEGQALSGLGNAYYHLGQVEKAISCYEQDLVIAREIGDRRGEGAVLNNLGIAYAALGQLEKAVDYYEQALVIARETRDRQCEGANLGNLGAAYARFGQAEKAISYYEQQLAIAREIGDRRGEGHALGRLGVAYKNLGQVERAIDCHEQALQIGQEIKDPRIVRAASANMERLRGGVNG